MPVPIIAAGISAGASLLGNRKTAAEKAMEGNARQQGAMASQIAAMAKQQHTMAGPALNKAMNHYMQLAGGNRAQLQSAMAPEMNMLMDTYKGAQMGTERMAPGPQRDRAIADLYRQKAGQMGMMPMQARQQAFGQLGDMGQNIAQMGNQSYGMAGNILGGQASALQSVAGMQQQRQAGWGALGGSIANIFMPYLMGEMGEGKLPSAQLPGMGNINNGLYSMPGNAGFKS